MKSQALSLANAARVAWRRSFPFLIALAMVIAAGTPAWSSDVIYLESNSTAGNSILAFKNDGSASPTFLGSTPAGGVGVFNKTFALGPFDSDQNLIENPEGTLLFAVNSGSNSIAVFRITPEGLQAVDGSPFPSGGSDPVSLGLKDDILTVVNKDQDPAQNANLVQPNYTTFRVLPNGVLAPIDHSTVSVAYGSSPSQALIASRGSVRVRSGFSRWPAAVVPASMKMAVCARIRPKRCRILSLPDRPPSMGRWECEPIRICPSSMWTSR